MPRRLSLIVRRTILSVLVVYLVIVSLMWAYQERFIFNGHGWQGHQWTILEPSADRELIPLKTSKGDSIYLLFQKATEPDGKVVLADAASRATILFFYGGGGTLAGSLELLSKWRALGINVSAVEYPGYGMSGGLPSEAAFYAAADAAYEHLVNRRDIDRKKLIVSGQSLGTGVAVDLASRKAVAALALFSPYTSVTAMAGVEYPWLPTSLMVRHAFRSDQKIQQVKVPILIAHGKNDRLIPTRMPQALASAVGLQRAKLLLVDADHIDLFDRAARELDAALQNLVDQVDGRP